MEYMRTSRYLTATLLVTVCLIAAQSRGEPIIDAQAQSEQIRMAKFQGDLSTAPTPGVLTISGQGYWNRKRVHAGEEPLLEPYDGNFNLLPDGRYYYTYKPMPETETTKRSLSSMQALAPRGHSLANENAQVVSGTFEIQAGTILQE